MVIRRAQLALPLGTLFAVRSAVTLRAPRLGLRAREVLGGPLFPRLDRRQVPINGRTQRVSYVFGPRVWMRVDPPE